MPISVFNRLSLTLFYQSLHRPKSKDLMPQNMSLPPLHQRIQASRVLFYPGAGQDISPALRFAQAGLIDTIVYCDYEHADDQLNTVKLVFKKFEDEYHSIQEDSDKVILEERQNAEVSIERIRLVEIQSITSDELGLKCRKDFFPQSSLKFGVRADDNKNTRIGTAAIYQRGECEAHQILFLYLDTEAIQTYIHLWGSIGAAPQILVVQDHSLGGLWTPFGGASKLFAAAPLLPQFIWLGVNNTSPWPHYKEISRHAKDVHSMHQTTRSLWECTLSDRINPDSALNHIVASNSETPRNTPYSKMSKIFRLGAPR
jgi:hypothetical protein